MRNKIPNKYERHRENPPDNESYWWLLATLFIAAIMGLVMVSCDDELPQAQVEEGLPATIRLNVMPDAATQTQTRADEGAVRDLHVLVYNSKGELIGRNYAASSTLTVDTRSGSGYTLYAIANTGDANLFSGTVVDTEIKLKTMKTTALTSWNGLTAASHLVMAGSKTGVTIGAGGNTLQGGMTVARMAAKVTLNMGIKSGSGITIKDYQVFSVPTQGLYVAGATDGATSWINGTLTTVNAASASRAFFMHENRRGTVGSITAQKDKGAGKAPGNATYMVINGEANGYKATWRVYLGENNTSDFNIKRNSQYTYNITLSRPGTDGADTRVTVEETLPEIVGRNANCYMLKPGNNNSVSIPVERANESPIELEGSVYNSKTKTYYQLLPNTTWTAFVVWETSRDLVQLSDVIGTGPSGSFNVTTTDASSNGNAVVAIKNAAGQILWSWHIWVTLYDGSTRFTNYNGLYTYAFMDCALGAEGNSEGKLSSCGLLYQWGRKDPFPGIGQYGGGWSTTGDPVRVYNAQGNLYEIPKVQTPDAAPNNLTNAIRNPDTFYHGTFDWYSPSGNNNLWSGASDGTVPEKSVFDPCPAGWCLPPWAGAISPFKGMENNGRITTYGRSWPGTGGYFPASGMRQGEQVGGGFTGVGQCGYYWGRGGPYGGKPSDYFYSMFLFFNDSSVDPEDYYISRSSGLSVRCCPVTTY